MSKNISREPAIVYWLDNKLYINITNQCSNDCWFCFRNYKKGVGGFNLKLTREPTQTEIFAELEPVLTRHWNEVVFCGFGEPTIRLDVLIETTRWIKRRYPNTPIRLNTNGHGYELNKGRDVAKELKTAGMSKVSISLNGYSRESYSENCRPRFVNAYDATLEFIMKAKAAGLDVEVSAIRMPEMDLQKVQTVVKALGIPFRIREYIPCFW